MADRARDRSPDEPGDGDPPEAGRPKRPDRRPEDQGEPSEHRKAAAEIEAGDVADDLADFA